MLKLVTKRKIYAQNAKNVQKKFGSLEIKNVISQS